MAKKSGNLMRCIRLPQFCLRNFRLVLCDIRMPQVDGIQVYAELFVHRPDVLPHLVLYSGSLSDPDVVRFLERTPLRVMAKPFDMVELIGAAEAARRA